MTQPEPQISLPARAARLTTAVPPFLLGLIGIALLTVMDGVVKELSPRYSALHLTFLRFAVTAVMGALLFLALRAPLPDRGVITGNLLRGVLVALSTLGFFYGLAVLPLAEVFIISFIAPLLVALIAIPLLGERPKPLVYLALALGFAGVMVTAGGVSLATIAPERALGIAAVLGCAVAYALSVVLLRQRAKRGDPPLTIALFQSAIPAAILALPAALFWAPITSADWPAFILIGALGLAGHVALALAFARGEASRLVAVEYTGLIWAILIGLVFFAEMPTPQAMLGAALIIGACWLLRR